MGDSLPPSFNSAIFNTSAFNNGGYITKAQGDRYYLPYSSYSLLNLLTGTPGVVVASKAVIVDSNKDIASFRNLTAVNLTGTLQTAAQPNITSLGTLTGLTMGGVLAMGTNNITGTGTIGGTLTTAAQPNITSLNAATLTASGIITFTNTSVSTTSTSNAVQISGGLYTAKAILNNSYYNCNTQNNTNTSYATSTQAICLKDHAIYFRNINSGDTNHGIMYSGTGNSNWNSSAGFASKSIDGPVLFGNTGVLIGSVNGGTQVAALSCISGNTNIYGTCFINSPPTMTNQSSAVQIQSTGYCLTLSNTSTYYTRLGTGSGGDFTIETNTSGGSGGFTPHVFSAGSLGLGLTPRFRLDFGNTANNFIIALYNGNNLEPTYGFGANGSALMYHSAGSNGHKWYINTTGGVGSPTTVGTNVMSLTTSLLTISSTNTTFPSNQYIGSAGFQNLFSLSSNGVFLIGTTSVYSSSNWLEVASSASGKSALFKGSVVIGASATSSIPLYVSGTGTSSTSSGFGYLASSGSGTATGFTNRAFSIQSTGGILCDAGEIDVLSDMRLKTNVNKLDNELCNRFIDNINPISFNYKVNKEVLNYGFSAQELVKYGFNHLVGFTVDENIDLSEEIVKCDDGTDVKLEKDTRLVVNLISMIPILVNLIKQEKDRTNNIAATLNKLIDSLSPGIKKKFDA